jgi:hypothetical protein
MGTYQKITLGKYRTLHKNGSPRAIPTMCVLKNKKDANLLPVQAKSSIVVLGNHEDRVWSKSEKYAPVLCSDSLRSLVSMAAENCRVLKQGNCKNTICNGNLSPDEVTTVQPPKGDPSAAKNKFWLLKKTLYGLRCSPRHWFVKIDKILKSMGLQSNPYNTCVYSGYAHNPGDPSDIDYAVPITMGLYVDDFIYFSISNKVDEKFQHILSRLINVYFTGTVKWFLGMYFSWHQTPEETAMYMN